MRRRIAVLPGSCVLRTEGDPPMSDLSLEDQNFAKRQTELIAFHPRGDEYVGEIILQIKPSRGGLPHLTPLNRLIGLYASGVTAGGGTRLPTGIGVMGIGDELDKKGTGVFGRGTTGVFGEARDP